MRILFLSHYYFPETNAPASRTFEHCTRWAKQGASVTVVTCIPNCPNGVPYPGHHNRFRTQLDFQDGVHIHRVWTYLAPNAGTVRRTINYVSYLLSATFHALCVPRPDVVIATSPQFFCAVAGAIAARWFGVPFVLEIRDIWPESIEAVGAMRRGLATRLLAALELWLYRSATKIVCAGDGLKDNVAAKLHSDAKLSVITNGVDVRQFSPRPKERPWLEQLGVADRFLCSYVGTIGMAHGLDIVIRAAERLRAMNRMDIAFALVGDGAHRLHMQELVASRGLNASVKFTGQVSKATAITALASTDVCLVHLKRIELFATALPSKLFEAMAMECPIIMGVIGPANDLVQEAGAGVSIQPENDEQLANALVQLVDAPEQLKRLGKSARSLIVSRFNRDALAADYLRLLQGVVGTIKDDDITHSD